MAEGLDDEPNRYSTGTDNEPDLQKMLADAITYKAPLKDLDIILRSGARINGSVNQGLRPLHYSVFDGDLIRTQFLLDKGALINVCDQTGYTPVHICCKYGHYDCLKLLIDEGAVINYCSEVKTEEDSRGGDTDHPRNYLNSNPLKIAIDNNNLGCVNLLLDYGAKPNVHYFMGYEINLIPLHQLGCLELLLKYGTDPDVQDRKGMTTLMKACREGNIDAIKLLIAYGAEVNKKSSARNDKKTAMHYAIMSGNKEVTELLLGAGVSPNAVVNREYTALNFAISHGKLNLCTLLIQRGAHVNQFIDNEDITCCPPLTLACSRSGIKNQESIIRLLLENGANPNLFNLRYALYGMPCLTPLVEYMEMNEHYNYNIIHDLIMYGSKVSISKSSKLLRNRKPYGVIQFLPKFVDYADIFYLLIDAAEEVNLNDTIRETYKSRNNGLLSRSHVRELLRICDALPLRNICRNAVRKHLRLCSGVLPENILQLRGPSFIRDYLLFNV